MSLARLKPFPFLHASHANAFQVFAGAEVSTSHIELHYRIKANSKESFDSIIFPDLLSKPLRQDDLWKSTCFEAFTPARESSAYLEFNGAPNGNWNWYAFRDYRQGMTLVPVVPGLMPKQVSISRGETEFEAKWILPFAGVRQGLLSGGAGPNDLGRFGLTVVLSTQEATTYWAVEHVGVKPDFHLKASFTYDPFRN
ncbi:MAG: hypothetical protein H7333_09385 [Bdellovibrionales bacterium]|nr:hypothetical protein [Oligoflexia bacterium]